MADGSAKRRPTIGMITAGPLIELAGEQWRGVSNGAQHLGCNLVCFVGSELNHPALHKRRANTVYDLISSNRIDALVVWTTRVGQLIGSDGMEEFVKQYAPMPIVSVETSLAEWPTILMDNRDGMKQAVDHLIEVHGKRRIAFVRGPRTHAGARDRFLGYADSLRNHGIPFDPSLVTMPGSFIWEPNGAAESVRKMFAHIKQPPDAIAAANDDYAIGVVSALEELGFRTPEDIAVVGYDNHTNVRTHDLGYGNPVSRVQREVNIDAATPAFTTVRAPFLEMGFRAAELAVALVRGEPTRQHQIMPTELIVRRSCGCLPSGLGDHAPAHDRLNINESATASTVADHLRDSLGPPSAKLPEGWAEQLVVELMAAGRGEVKGAEFLELLAEYIRTSARAGCEAAQWWPPLFDLHRFVTARISDATIINDLWLRVQLLLGDAFATDARFKYLSHERHDQTVREAGQRLIASRDVDELTNALSEELPRLGIPGCHVMAYDTPGTARALVRFEGNELKPTPDTPFPTINLTPYPFRRNTPFSALVAPLYTDEDHLGYVIFEEGPEPGWIYEAVQQQLSSALRTIRLMQELKDARARLEERVGETEAQLRHAQKMEAIGRLTGGIAHDFNNILTVVNGNSEMLLRRTLQDDPRRAAIEDIRHAGERAANLTRQLLAFTRQQVLHPESLDLKQNLTKVHSMLRTLVGDHIELEMHLPEDVARVWADAGQVEQILFNLAVNSRDAMPDGGTLVVSIEDATLGAGDTGRIVGVRPGEYVLMRVQDTGAGMAPDVRAQVFEPYFTTKPVGKGTGLGLSTVFGIVQQSGGQIEVISALGSGTTVEVYLPVPHKRDGTPEAPCTRRTTSHQGAGTVLLVEDDAQVRIMTRRSLETAGYAVIEASDGQEALQLATAHRSTIDLVLTDVVMPKMGGPELVRLLRSTGAAPAVIYMSGYTTDEVLDDEVLITKPYVESDLLERVRELLNQDA
ncbi:substrate-binding domain-containing protein [Lentzea sp. BCCO 10_0856]|uniref:histidine kinase n=1 Tax=Lentzea miocenica TaxID=3095431 RepID=A0ABU4TD34_9PSEU|nr:substrate-binding domain-containing protein [Lentzea sp. BCCO 10_0856]MDX8036107.1 substrate-binding domain-containing protein [Lentzea sp. BCCO 10_0856]